MLMKWIMLMNLILTMMLMKMKSPLKSNLLILTQSIALTYMVNLMNKTSWISFTIFILYISGLMIIFLYISSISFNELSLNKIKNKNFFLKMILFIIFMYIINYNFNLENFNYENKFLYEDNYYFLNMFMIPNNFLIYFILTVLFFMLILIIWMLKNNKGPIRQKK